MFIVDKIDTTIQLITAALKFQNNAHIQDQTSVINSFLSTVTIIDSQISSISLDTAGLSILSSTLEIDNIQISGIETQSDAFFISASLDSSLDLKNIVYSNSNALLFEVRTSTISVNKINFTNINNAPHLFKIDSSSDSDISDVTSVDAETKSGYLFSVTNSKNMSFNNVNVESSKSTVFRILSSDITIMNNITIKDSYQGMNIEASDITKIVASEFNTNGNLTLTQGGAIHITDSIVNVEDTSFIKNKAKTGAAIYFNCVSMNK